MIERSPEPAYPPLPADWESRDSTDSYAEAIAALRALYAAGITGMDVPSEPWTEDDVRYWTGSARYQPWRDVAALFRERTLDL